MAWAFDDEDVDIWWVGEDFPQRVIEHIETGGLMTAHQSDFERHLFFFVVSRLYGFAAPKLEQWRCSMARALACGYPAGLGALADGLGLKYRKQAQGTRLIRDYCVPGHLEDFKPGDKDLMGEYCIYDVKVMREAVKCLRDLTDEEWSDFHLNCRINDRGLPMDVELCEAALGYANEIAEDANGEIARITGGLMNKATQRKSRDAFVLPKLTEPQRKMLSVYKKGVEKLSFDQEHRGYLLACDDLNIEVRALLEQIDNAGSSALKKYAVAAHQHVQGRLHNTFLWHGAQPGRFAGKGFQPHNIIRDAYKETEAEKIIADILSGYELNSPANTMARLLRSAITHKEGVYYVDWSAIQGRIAPWLSVSPSGEKKLDLYRENKDVYVETASSMFHVPVQDIDKTLRQSGKIAELSLQFGGSHGALIGMGRKFGVTFEEDEAKDIVIKWRNANPWAEQIWAAYDKAISLAVRAPGTTHAAGLVTFYSDGVNFLWCRLPSGNLLAYPRPRWELYMTPWGAERVGATFQMSNKPAAGEPPLRKHARGALIFQNVVQAIESVLLRRTLREAEAEGLNIVGHIHDEVIGIGPKVDGELLNEIMLEEEPWMAGLPVNTGGVEYGKRFGK